MSGPIILGLTLGAVQIITNRVELFQRDINGAVLPSGQEQRILPFFQIPLNGRPSRGTNAETCARDMGGDFGFLQSMKLFQLFEAKGENVVVERPGGTAEDFVERFVRAG